MFSTLFFCAANILANGDFEAFVGRDAASWELPKSPATYRVADGVGRNGSHGLVWDDPKGDVYVMARSRIDVKPGVPYSFGGWIKADSFPKHGDFAALYFDWYSKDGKWLDGCSSTLASKTGDWMRVSGRTDNGPENAAYGVLLAYAKKGAKGRVVFDDLFVEPLKVEPLGGMYSSAYRNAAVDGRVRFFVEINKSAPEMKLPDLKVAFRLPVGLLKWRELPTFIRDGYATAEVDVSELRFGKSPVQFIVKSAGKYVTSKVLYFERFRGKDPRPVRFDERNRTIVNGKPFFPLGMYASVVTEKELEKLTSGGFNCVMPYRAHSLTESILDKCAEKGLMVMPNIKDTLFGERYTWDDVVDPQTGDACAAEQVSRMKDHPAILAWYSCDESEEAAIPRLRERQRLLEELDPDHPTWIVLYQAPAIRKYMGAFDVIGTDPYPVADLGQYPKRADGMKRVTNWTRQTYEGVFHGSRPLWQVPQCFDWAIIRKTEAERLSAPSRAPTYDEVRNMAWQCLVGGANGLVFYSYHDLLKMEKRTPFKKSFGIVSKVAKEVRSYERFLLGDLSEAVASDNENVVSRQWVVNGKRLFAVVNATDKPQSATVEGERYDLKPLEIVLKNDKYVKRSRLLFKAGLITDTHVGRTKDTCRNVKAAWELFAKERVDLVANIGDIADHHYPSGYVAYRETVDGVLASNPGWRPEELYVYAWHDAYAYKGDLNRSVPKSKEAFVDVRRYLRANDTYAEIQLGGSPILVFPQMLGPNGYDRYESMVKSAVERSPGRPVFVLDHIPPRGTVASGGGDPVRRRILNKYPSVVLISGHMHGSILGDRHIWQDQFTAVNCGCMYKWGGSLVGHSVPSRTSYNAMVMEVYDDKILFRRFPDVFSPVEHAPESPWRVDLPYSRDSARYLPERRTADETVAGFPADAKLSVTAEGSPMKSVKVSFPAAVEPPYCYRIEAFVKDSSGKSMRMLRRDMFGNYDMPAGKRPETIDLDIPAGYFDPNVRHEFVVVPYGFFGKDGPQLAAQFRTPSAFAEPGGRKVYEVRGASEVLPVFSGWNGVKSVASCDDKGVYGLNGGIMRLHLPKRLWDVPKGTKFRCECDFRIVAKGEGSYNVGLACPSPLRYLGRARTPPGDTGNVRTIIEFTKESDAQFFDLCVEGYARCSFELKRLSIFRY